MLIYYYINSSFRSQFQFSHFNLNAVMASHTLKQKNQAKTHCQINYLLKKSLKITKQPYTNSVHYPIPIPIQISISNLTFNLPNLIPNPISIPSSINHFNFNPNFDSKFQSQSARATISQAFKQNK